MGRVFEVLQKEQWEWQLQNFGQAPPSYWCLLGIVEELGEFDIAETDEAVIDAIGDIMIYMSGYCSGMGWDLQEIYESELLPEFEEDNNNTFLSIAGKLCRTHLKAEQGIRGTVEEHRTRARQLLRGLIEGLDYALTNIAPNQPLSIEGVTEQVWNKIVKKRNWVSNPKTGT